MREQLNKGNSDHTQKSGAFLFRKLNWRQKKQLNHLVKRADLQKRLYEEAENALDKYTTYLLDYSSTDSLAN
jgi:hypothetical protein